MVSAAHFARLFIFVASLCPAWARHHTEAHVTLLQKAPKSAADLASGAAVVAQVDAQNVNITSKLQGQVNQLAAESAEKVTSLKNMLTTNSKSIAALTGLFKEISKLTTEIGQFEDQLASCRKDLAVARQASAQGPADAAYLDTVDNDPLLSFLQQHAETALHKAGSMLSKLHGDSPILLQQGHRHHRQPSDEEQENDSQRMAFGLDTISGDEEDMASRVQNVRGELHQLPGMDPLSYGMYDMTGPSGVHIFDRQSMDPEFQRKHALQEVNFATQAASPPEDDDDDE